MEEKEHRALGAWLALPLLLAILFVVGLALSKKPRLTVRLADGRILQVESVTFGVDHHVGWDRPSQVLRFLARHLPARLSHFLPAARPSSRMHFTELTLMVWVNARDPITGKYVDCQQIRIEIVDDCGIRYGGSCCSALSSADFWRCGHVFRAFPRTQRKLTLHITPSGSDQCARLEIPNPHIATTVVWAGSRLPQSKIVGNMEIAITGLVMRTNSPAHNHSEPPGFYWEPIWELRQARQPAVGWDAPQWTAEDPSGNRSRFLGVHQPVLRFDATFYPNATNIQAALLIGTSPPVALDGLQSNVWWNMEIPYHRQTIVVLGLFPPGTHVFSRGRYETNSVAELAPPSNRRPSGWDGYGKTVGSGKFQSWSRHHTPVPTIYLRAPGLHPIDHLGVRIRDERGRYWNTRIERAGDDEELACLLEVPPDVKTVIVEILLLKPVRADFLVQTTP